MKIVNKKKFFITGTISIIFLLIITMSISKCTLSHSEEKFTQIYVEYGDTLWEISKQQQINNNYYKNTEIRKIINDIKKANNLKTSNLSIGQKLKIPTI